MIVIQVIEVEMLANDEETTWNPNLRVDLVRIRNNSEAWKYFGYLKNIRTNRLVVSDRFYCSLCLSNKKLVSIFSASAESKLSISGAFLAANRSTLHPEKAKRVLYVYDNYELNKDNII